MKFLVPRCQTLIVDAMSITGTAFDRPRGNYAIHASGLVKTNLNIDPTDPCRRWTGPEGIDNCVKHRTQFMGLYMSDTAKCATTPNDPVNDCGILIGRNFEEDGTTGTRKRWLRVADAECDVCNYGNYNDNIGFFRVKVCEPGNC